MKEADKVFKGCKGIFLGILIVLGILALRKSYSAQPPVDRLISGTVIELNDKWERNWNEEEQSIEYCYVIPETWKESASFVMKSYLREFELLLNGERFYSFSDHYGVKGGSRFVVTLPEGCFGKQFVLRVKGQSDSQNPVILAYLGGAKEMAAKLWQDNMYALLFGVCSFLAGTGLCLMAAYLKRHNLGVRRKCLVDLSGFMFVTGIWVVTDSGLLLCLTNQVALINIISFVSFFIMPVFLLRFISDIWVKTPVLNGICQIFLIIAGIYLLNYLVPVVPGYVLLLPDHILCFTAIGVVLKKGWKQMRYQEKEEIRKLFAGLAILCLFAMISFVIFYINPTYNYPIVYSIGIFLFYLVLLDMTFSTLYKQMKKTASLDIYKRMAYTDSMVGMENRAAFTETQKKNPLTRGRSYILMDINNLKMVNDRYGHFEGDRLIQAAANCILDVFGETGRCYRIGGDEFVVILENDTEEVVKKALKHLQERIQEENEQKEIALSIAAGYATWQKPSDTAQELFQRADTAMYARKQQMKQQKTAVQWQKL
ncbi:MAG: GGDEF domain-containing protein [Lachnospiraceae bacterium]|nr:GGDEF domain-containing protein [Lachnospiraceae bacterium]